MGIASERNRFPGRTDANSVRRDSSSSARLPSSPPGRNLRSLAPMDRGQNCWWGDGRVLVVCFCHTLIARPSKLLGAGFPCLAPIPSAERVARPSLHRRYWRPVRFHCELTYRHGHSTSTGAAARTPAEGERLSIRQRAPHLPGTTTASRYRQTTMVGVRHPGRAEIAAKPGHYASIADFSDLCNYHSGRRLFPRAAPTGHPAHSTSADFEAPTRSYKRVRQIRPSAAYTGRERLTCL